MHEKNYHSTKLEFLALKWAIMEHFKEYLLYQPFLEKTDNNPLTYIMTTPNWDATGHWWVSARAKYDFQLEYQKGWANAVADTLSQVTTHLELEAVQAILDGATVGTSQRVEGENPAIIKSDQQLEKEVWVATGWVLVEMHVTDWGAAQKEDPQAGCSSTVVGVWEENWSEDTPQGVYDQQGGPDGVEKLPELHFPLRHPLFVLHPQRGEWGSVTLCCTQSALNCHPKWMPSRCRTPRLWLYPFPVTRMFLVARNGQADEASYQGLQTLPPIWGWHP